MGSISFSHAQVSFALKELQQEITLIPLQPSAENKEPFDPTLFYKELLQLNDEEAEILKKLTTSTWDELEARLKGLEDKRRRLAALDFHLGKVFHSNMERSLFCSIYRHCILP